MIYTVEEDWLRTYLIFSIVSETGKYQRELAIHPTSRRIHFKIHIISVLSCMVSECVKNTCYRIADIIPYCSNNRVSHL
jgi:hypothetical protein